MEVGFAVASAFLSIYASKLASLEKELAEKEEARRKAEEEFQRLSREGVHVSLDLEAIEREREEIVSLKGQVALLRELKATVDKQQVENRAQFVAIEKRDEQSSKQSFRLTVVSSGVSLLAGWLLSLAGSPAALLHIFGR